MSSAMNDLKKTSNLQSLKKLSITKLPYMWPILD